MLISFGFRCFTAAFVRMFVALCADLHSASLGCFGPAAELGEWLLWRYSQLYKTRI